MGELINQWVYNIVIVVLFISFLEMLIPQGETKKYIRVVMSLLIILTIISPLLKFISPGWGDSLGFSENGGRKIFNFSEIISEGEDMRATNEKNLRSEYEGLIAQQIRTLISMQKGIKRASVKVQSDDKTGKLSLIYIKVSKKTDTNTVETVKIPEIKIKVEQALARNEHQATQKEDSIRTMIANLYNLDREQVIMDYI